MTVGTEFLVNTYTASSQFSPSITHLEGGGFVVSWMSLFQDGIFFSLRGQVFDADGTAVGSEIEIGSNSEAQQTDSVLTALPDGGFMAAWSNGEIMAQRYDSLGNLVDDEFQVNTYDSDGQTVPSIATLSDGGIVITWNSSGQDGSGLGVYGQIYNADFTTQGSEFHIPTQTSGGQHTSVVTQMNDGGFMVAWESAGQDGSNKGVFGQRYDASGVKDGLEFQVNTYTTNNQQNITITNLTDGGFVVVWESTGQDGASGGIYGQIYNADSSVQGSEFIINTITASNQIEASITATSDGGFVVVWRSHGNVGNGFNVFGQRYDGDGNTTGSEFLINTGVAGTQYTPDVSTLPDGNIVVAWVSSKGDGSSSSGIIAKVISGTAGEASGEVSISGDFLIDAPLTAVDDSIFDINGIGQYSYQWQSNGTDIVGATEQTYSPTDAYGGTDITVIVSFIDGIGGSESITSAAYAIGTGKFVLGTTASETLIGTDGDDLIFGDDGDDILIGGDGGDELEGGNGSDTVDYSASDEKVLINLQNNSHSKGHAEGDSLVDIQNVIGSAYDDILIGDSEDNIFTGGKGADTIQTADGDDKVYAEKGDDHVELGAGDDYVRVGGGAEYFDGGEGVDTISYYKSSGGVTIDLSTNEASGSWAENDTVLNFENVYASKAGDDYIVGSSDDNLIKTYGGDDKVYAGKGDDVVKLGSGDDYVRVGGGEEYFDGGSGTDTISYYKSSGGVTINLATNTVSGSWAENDTVKNFENVYASKTGDDHITGTSGANYIKTYGGDDRVYSGGGDDIVKLGSGDDYVKSGGGADILYGGSGDDRFDAGSGDDIIYGGSGADSFHYDFGEGFDTIKDFEDDIDIIQLDNSGYADIAEAMTHATQVDDDVVLDFGNGDGLTIENATLSQVIDDLLLVQAVYLINIIQIQTQKSSLRVAFLCLVQTYVFCNLNSWIIKAENKKGSVKEPLFIKALSF